MLGSIAIAASLILAALAAVGIGFIIFAMLRHPSNSLRRGLDLSNGSWLIATTRRHSARGDAIEKDPSELWNRWEFAAAPDPRTPIYKRTPTASLIGCVEPANDVKSTTS